MPRLSINIDVVFTDHTLDREAALRVIATDVKGIKSAISAMGYRAVLPTTKSGDEVKLLIDGNGAQVNSGQLRLSRDRTARGTTVPHPHRARTLHNPISLYPSSTPQSCTAANLLPRWIDSIHATSSTC